MRELQRFRVKCRLLGIKAGKGWLLNLGRMFANDAKTGYMVELYVMNIFNAVDGKEERGKCSYMISGKSQCVKQVSTGHY